MNNALLIDTDVLIDYLRGKEQAVVYLENLKQPVLISSINVVELYSGVRKGKEEVILAEFLQAFEIIPVTFEIAQKGGLLHRDFSKSHGVSLADSIIAATIEILKCNLVTLNKKHYPMIKNVVTPYRR